MPRFLIKAPRFIEGELLVASPEHPREIELPAGTKVDAGLIPLDSPEAKAPPLKPHYVVKENRGAAGAKDVYSKPLAEQTKGKRPSDGEP